MPELLSTWHQIQSRIASCQECCSRWPRHVISPLSLGEIPDPPTSIQILFIGVAPTSARGRNKGSHFYTSERDPLRRELFKLLSAKPFALPLNGLGLKEGVRAFTEAGLFFIHAAKVRPLITDAPPEQVIAFCAKHHMLEEISLLRPKAICILSKARVGPLTLSLFGYQLGHEVESVSLGTWNGLAIVAPQPVRGWAPKTQMALEKLLFRLNSNDARKIPEGCLSDN